MKAVILAGGLGTRLAEETGTKPKPMVEAGGRPLIWHIMSNYARAGVTDFLVLAGYKGDVIREYFANFWLHQADVTFDLGSSRYEVRANRATPWSVTVLDTGQQTMTGGRLARASEYLPSTFFLTYGDGVSDVDVRATLESHRSNQDAIVTLTAMRPPARFGALQIEGSRVQAFQEKPTGDGTWVNGGYFVMEPEIFKLLGDDDCVLERDLLPALANAGKLGCYKHPGTFQPVDTVRDLAALEAAIGEKAFPWI